jgi:hypothetical protein
VYEILGWVVFGMIILLAAWGIYRSVRFGVRAAFLLGTRGLVAAGAAFASYLVLVALLGNGGFTGETFLTLSLTLGVPLLFGMLAQGVSSLIFKRRPRP